MVVPTVNKDQEPKQKDPTSTSLCVEVVAWSSVRNDDAAEPANKNDPFQASAIGIICQYFFVNFIKQSGHRREDCRFQDGQVFRDHYDVQVPIVLELYLRCMLQRSSDSSNDAAASSARAIVSIPPM